MKRRSRTLSPDDPSFISRAAFETRCELMREHGCLCCLMAKELGFQVSGFGIPEIHHLNEGGIAGNKRRGDRFTVPLCSYHHRGKYPLDALRLGLTLEEVQQRYGPSWAHGSKLFREFYPDDDALLLQFDGE